jgi:hypothetical protein
MADTFRAQQMEKYRAVDEALADEEFMAQFLEEAPPTSAAGTATECRRGGV